MTQAQPSSLQQLLRAKLGLDNPKPAPTPNTVHQLAEVLSKHLGKSQGEIIEAANAKIVGEMKTLVESINLLKRADTLVDEAVAERNLMAAGVDARIADLMGAKS